jgi:hypothetical protein
MKKATAASQGNTAALRADKTGGDTDGFLRLEMKI